MPVSLNALSSRYQQLSVRERILLLLVLVVLIYQLADTLLLSYQAGRADAVRAQINEAHAAQAQMAQEITEITGLLQNDPNKPLKARAESLKSTIDKSKRELRELARQLIAPGQMSGLLEQMLLEQGKLTLQRLETLGVAVLQERDAVNEDDEPTAAPEFPVYKHGFAIEFSGSYLDTLEYLETLEKLPQRFYWDRVDFKAQEYPINRVRIELHTLSLSEDWIGV